MADEFRHKDVVSGRITENEFENVNQHIFNSQAVGDLLYASGLTQLSRLGIGAADTILSSQGGVPTWRTPAQILTDLSGQAGAAFDWGGQNLTNLGSLAAHSLAGKLTGGAQEIEGSAFDINGGTMAGVTLDGTLTLGGQAFDAGAVDAQINTTGPWTGLLVQLTADGPEGAQIGGYVDSASPANDDALLGILGKGKDSNGDATTYASYQLQIENATHTTECGKQLWRNKVNNAWNDCMKLSSLGVLDVDASSGLGAATVGEFDEYDDAMILKQGISDKALEKLEEIGVLSRKDSGSGWMLNIQAMLYLLAGGVYQNRARIDDINSRILALPQRS